MSGKSNVLWWILGGGALYFLMTKKDYISAVSQSLLDDVNSTILYYSLPTEAQPYADVIKQVAVEKGVDPLILAALGQQESRWGAALSPKGPAGTGDSGHGHGIGQIDDRTWSTWLASNDWTDPYTNVSKAADILNTNLSYFSDKGLAGDDLTRAALAAYNAGPGNVWASIQAGQSPDAKTTGGNYSSSVMNYFAQYSNTAQDQLAAAGVA